MRSWTARSSKLALEIFDGGRRGVLTESETGAGGIKNADGFVGELTTGDEAVGEFDGGGDAFVENADFVVLFEEAGDAAHHYEALLFAGFFHFDNLEAAGERGILFEILFVFRPGGSGDGAEFATGEGWFENVSGVILTGRATGTDHSMSFVNEQNDGDWRAFDFFDQTLETIFKFAFDAGAGLQQCHVKGAHFDISERRRDIALHDAHGETFDDGGFADTGFTCEDGIVLAAANEDVDDLANFEVAAEDGVDFSVAGVFCEVDGELIEVRGFARAGR